jgi:hypothetical protein
MFLSVLVAAATNTERNMLQQMFAFIAFAVFPAGFLQMFP